MKKHWLGAVALLVLGGCSPRLPVSLPPEPPTGATLAEVSNPTPVSIAVVPVLDAYDSGHFASHTPGMAVLSSAEELAVFLQGFPRYLPPGWKVPPPLPESLSGFDFSKYRAVAVSSVGQNLELGRIVGIEDQADRWVVHTMRWKTPVPKALKGYLHIVGVPRSDKPIAFATPVEKTLAPAEEPKWKAIANPEMTRDKVEALIRSRHRDSTIEAVSVEKRTMQAARDQLQEAIPSYMLPESEVWVVRMTGSLYFNALPGGQETRFPAVTQVLTLDTAVPMAIAAK